jgi:hypothetical protein
MEGEAELQSVRAIRAGMTRQFAAWSISSIMAGLVIAWSGRTQESASRAFLEALGVQSVIWGAINLVFAVLGLRQSARARRTPIDAASIDAELRERDGLVRTLRFNGKLNVLWVSIGIVLLVSAGAAALRGSERPTVASLLGHATGVLVQGWFLLSFDRAFLRALSRSSAPLSRP